MHTGVAEILAAHILQRCSWRARGLIPNNQRKMCWFYTEEYAKLYMQTQVCVKALEAARKGKYNFNTCDI